jgi:hypothetical protein
VLLLGRPVRRKEVPDLCYTSLATLERVGLVFLLSLLLEGV